MAGTDDTRELLAELVDALAERFSRAASIGELEQSRDLWETLESLRARLSAKPEPADKPFFCAVVDRELPAGTQCSLVDCCRNSPPVFVESEPVVTEEMLFAGRNVNTYGREVYGEAKRKSLTRSCLIDIYRAMHAAAPKPQITDEVVWRIVSAAMPPDGDIHRARDRVRQLLEAVWPR